MAGKKPCTQGIVYLQRCWRYRDRASGHWGYMHLGQRAEHEWLYSIEGLLPQRDSHFHHLL